MIHYLVNYPYLQYQLATLGLSYLHSDFSNT
uniref:Uncharacterized protein n=1 Tax=Arundo donax TaxID=35708 RepID=A0A0A9BYN2_ARUDO